MAKSLIYLAVGALALTACTSDDVIDDVKTSKSNVIKFENVVDKHSRADITNDNLDHFYVFGFYTLPGKDQLAHEVFYNVPVNKVGGVWNYADDFEGTAGYGERYWIPGAKYHFYAYSCDNKRIGEDKVPGITYELDMTDGKDAKDRELVIDNYVCNNSHQHDLVFAYNTGGGDSYDGILALESGNNDVTLEFKHILSKVKAQFTTKFPKEYQIVISDVTIQGINDQGDFSRSKGWFNHTQTVANQALEMLSGTLMVENKKEGSGDNAKQMAAKTEQFYAIPFKGQGAAEGGKDVKYALKFTIDVYVGDDRENKVMSKTLTGAFTPAWQDGYQYVYNVDINGNTTHMQVISFTTTVDGFNSEVVSTDITDFDVKDNGVK